MECIETLIKSNAESFQPFVNITFDLLFAKLADSKVILLSLFIALSSLCLLKDHFATKSNGINSVINLPCGSL